MNRSQIIKRLVKEGMSEKTLASFSDKQIMVLADRMLSEQKTETRNVTTYSRNDPKQMSALNAKMKQAASNPNAASNLLKNTEISETDYFNTEFDDSEFDETEEDFYDPYDTSDWSDYEESKTMRSGSKDDYFNPIGDKNISKAYDLLNNKREYARSNIYFPKKNEYMQKSTMPNLKSDANLKFMNRSKRSIDDYLFESNSINESKKKLSPSQSKKMDTDKDGDIDAKDLKTLRSRKPQGQVNEKSKPSTGLSAKKKSEVVKSAKAGNDIGKKGKGFEKIASTAAKKYDSEEKGKKVAAAAMWKNIKRENVEVKNWLKMLAEENFHSFTSKGEIMELIQSKMQKNVLPDFFKAKAIKSSGVKQQTNEGETTTKPKTKPSTKPTTKPGTKPGKPKRDPFSPKPQPNPAPQAESAPATKPKTKPKTKPTTKPSKPKRDPFSPKPQPNPAPQAENKKIGK